MGVEMPQAFPATEDQENEWESFSTVMPRKLKS
jgi:hypothetical protein